MRPCSALRSASERPLGCTTLDRLSKSFRPSFQRPCSTQYTETFRGPLSGGSSRTSPSTPFCFPPAPISPAPRPALALPPVSPIQPGALAPPPPPPPRAPPAPGPPQPQSTPLHA